MYGIIFLLMIVLPLGQSTDVDYNVDTMQHIRANMDSGIPPCTNFWGYACGNWSSKYMDNFGKPEREYAFRMLNLFAVYGYEPNMPRIYQKVNNYFGTCITYEPREFELPPELRTVKTDWTVAAAKYRKYGLNGVFFDEAADVAYNYSLRYVVQLKMPTVLKSSSSKFERDLQDLVERYSSNAEGEESSLQSWTLAELEQQIPQINWQNYFKELLETELNELDLRLEVSDVEYLRAVGQLLNRSNITTIQEHLSKQLIRLAKEASPKEHSDGKFDACLHHMRALLPLGVNYLYDHFVDRGRTRRISQIYTIFQNLRGTFGKYLAANRLQLNSQQLAFVGAKLANMKLKIGNLPADSLPPQFYDNHYSTANFSRLDFQQNLWQALRLRTYLQHAPLLQAGAALNLTEYYLNDDVFVARNAPYFEAERNTVTVPLIFLQFPLYDQRQHLIFQHSLLGFILAHELSHAFDQDGIIFDAAGNESPIGLSIRNLPAFQAALNCVQRRRKTASLKERVADVNGLQLAYDTFFGMFHDSHQLEYRPYVFERKFRAPQLFHLNFAQFFCGNLPQAIAHDMDDVRVNEAVRNLHQFAIDFNCEQQSMDCEMWRPVRP